MKKTTTLKYILILLVLIVSGIEGVFAQCPDVTITHQSFCDVESPTIANLVATDNGNGIVWYSSASSTVPLPVGTLLIHGATYYADDNSGACGARQSVFVTVYAPPTGPSFQTPCVEDISEATIGSHLALIGNNVQWYSVPEGGTPLPLNTQITDNTIYYASQINPNTGCETSRKAVFVDEVVIISPPQGEPIQYFCNEPGNMPTLADIVVIAPGVKWYPNATSVVQLPLSTPLSDGITYYAASVSEPCTSTTRLGITVEFLEMNDAGNSYSLNLCDTNFPPTGTLNLFDGLGGTPSITGAWSGDVATTNGHLGTVDLTILDSDVVYTFTYTVQDSTVCPEATATVVIIITNSKDPGEDGITPPICANSADEINLFDYLNGTPDIGGVWGPALASGTGIFNPALDVFGVYTYTFNDGCSDTATVTVIEQTTLDAGEDGFTPLICPSGIISVIDLFDYLNGTPDLGGIWVPALTSGTGIFNPAVDAFGVYTYTFNDGCSIDTATVTVIEQPVLDPGEDGVTPPICPSGIISVINLFDYLNGTPDLGGSWVPALASGTGIFNPSVDAFGVYTYTFNDGCSETATVTVIEQPVLDPGENGVTPPICANSNDVINLFDFLNGTPDVGGVWVPALASGTGIFNPAVDAFGVYIYMFNDGCSFDTATVTVIEQPVLDPGEDGVTPPICPSGIISVINLFDYLNGTPDLGGSWVPALASGTGIFNPSVDAFGVYTYTFNDGCSETATVTVIEQPVLDPGENGVTPPICANSNDVINLFDFLNGTPDVGGVWVPALASGTGIFNPAIDTFGVYTYTFNDGCSQTANVTVIEESGLNAGDDGFTPPICPNDVSVINLFDYLNGTPDAGGIWVPALASGTGIFNPSVDAFGLYTYMFNDGCNDSATVTVVMQDTLDPGLSNSFILCPEDTAIVDLFSYLGGNPDVGGIWVPALASGTGIFDPAVDAPGIYTYTFNNGCSLEATITVIQGIVQNPGEDGFTPPICPNDVSVINLFDYLNGTPDVGGIWVPALASGTGVFNPAVDPFGVYIYTFNDGCSGTATVTIVMEDTPDPGLSNSFILCPGDTELVDLFGYLGGNPDVGGVWVPALASGTGIFDPAVDAPGIYTYTFNNGCSLEATITVIQGIIQNPGEDGATQPICPNSTDDIDLFDYLGGNPDLGGVWVPALASGTGIFNPAVDAFGVYIYTFNDGCSGTALVTVVMEDTPDPGLSNSFIFCPGETTPVDLFSYLGGNPDVGGVWVPALASGSGIFDPAVDAPGIYTYTFNNGCSLEATITVIQGIIQNPGEDGFTPPICPNSIISVVDLFDHLNGTPDAGGIWVPALASGTGIFNPALDAFGVYTYTFNDGCSDSATVTVVMQDTPDPGLSNSFVLCPLDTTLVDLFDYLGGNPDVGGVWVPVLASGTGIFDPAEDSFGVYTYTFNNGCSLEATITVIEDVVQNPGEDGVTQPICPNGIVSVIDLFDYLGGNPDVGGVWVPALASGAGIFNPALDAFGVYTYTFNDGCSDTATVTVVLQDTFDSGLSNTVTICPLDTTLVNLFDYLGGNPDAGGVWVPALASGTGIFDPAEDAFGVYTYTFNDGCSLEATITVIEDVVQNPGEDGATPPICPNPTDYINLFDYLGGNPDLGGAWVPALASGTGIFDPAVDAFGVYTYTFNDGCSDTATVTVVMEDTPDPGFSNSFILCPGDTTQVDLFDYLGGNPDVGGVWVPALASGTGIFDPAVDAPGIYSYTFNNGCSLEATITVIQGIIQNPGFSNSFVLCSGDTTVVNLFDYLGGNPDVGGVWVPALTSGTGIFNPAVDAFGVYTYMFNDGCSDTATVTVVEDSCIEELVIPDGFSPNQDGINDYFEILNLRTLYPNYKIEIYNRYGNILFSGNALKPDWDGTTSKSLFGDGIVPVGVYFFIIEFNDGQREPLQGRLYLSR